MATIIDTTYFYEDISIAGVADAPAVQASVRRYIQKYEPEVLRALLGYALYESLVDNDAPERMVHLVEGTTYTSAQGVPTRWRGLKEEVATGVYRSLIAQYVYYQYTYYNATITTGVGEKRIRTENAVDASPELKLVRAWNNMVAWNCELVTYLLAHEADYPEFALHYRHHQRDMQHLLTYKNRFGL